MLTAGGIIEQARERHPAFDKSRHPNKVVRGYLSRYVKRLHGRIAAINPSELRQDMTQALPLADHAAGITLDSNRLVEEVVAFDAQGSEYRVDLIPAIQRLDSGIRAASAWQIGSKLYLTSPASNWQRMVSLAIAIVPIPTALADQDSTVAMPDTAEDALVTHCADFMAGRLRGDEGLAADERRKIATEAIEAEESFLNDVTNRLSAVVIRTRDVYRP